ncbi:hypothetical protein [Haloprofundus halobius]|uniref:glycoside hydrolase family 38 N-terminal domain-containing protein n=1 Tax=Haloprofundus halobius TaxID=2876194 RepID=UPI001CD00A14|nr:hypothetical protein [Haloprofundus halobius]
MTQVDTIQLINHCHTDIGYTHDQPVLWDLQRRFIDDGIAAAAEDLEVDSPDAFHWTIETTGPLLRWLETASDKQIEQLQRLEEAGRVEVTGMLANITPLYGPAQTDETLRPIQRLRDEYGFDIKYGMNCDVNGQNWSFPDALLDAGIEGFSMAINEHFGGAPLKRPEVFRWEAPSGRELLAFNGYHYSTGHQMGIGRDLEELRDKWWPRVERQLEAAEYPLSKLLIQSYHPFGDNGPAYREFSDFIREWNDLDAVLDGELPVIEMATPADWWEHVQSNVDCLEAYSGDWTDFWNFGSISSAREMSINRENRRRLLTADALEAGLGALGAADHQREPTRRSAPETRDDAWWATHFFDEHTWGSDTAVSVPEGEDAASQWNHKANYAYHGRSLSMMRQRDSIAELARRVSTGDTQ